MAFIGWIVAGAWIGRLILERTPESRVTRLPYSQVLLGILVLQLVVLVPGIGLPAALLVAMLGTGSVADLL